MMAIAKTTDRKASDKQARRTAPKAAVKAAVKGPWPDQKARQDMSEAELAREDGKHDKNADWKW